jgi:CubicO group peptidase (beta-lactamase class C family)
MGYDRRRFPFLMRRTVFTLTALAAVLLVCQPAARAQDLVFERFRDALDALRSQAGIPGLSATIVGTNDIAWEAAFGKQDLERSFVARPDTPYHLDGITQTFTAMLVLGCFEVNRVSLDDPVGRIVPNAPEPNATIRQLLSHTGADGVFRYRLDRLNVLSSVLEVCQEPFQNALAKLFDQQAMNDSVPGTDVVQLTPGPYYTESRLSRYNGVLGRLATPYSVDSRGISPSRYAASTLLASRGVISTTRDVAKFLVGLMRGVGVGARYTSLMWKAAVGPNGQPLPHGLGWFVQSYNGETVVWQYGVTDNACSALIVTVPGRGLSLVLLANSDGLSRAFPLAAGDLTVSPFGRLFLGSFIK